MPDLTTDDAALRCPTLLENGYGGHRIQGIGDKHVPWIHNVRNTDLVIAVDDELNRQWHEWRDYWNQAGVDDPRGGWDALLNEGRIADIARDIAPGAAHRVIDWLVYHYGNWKRLDEQSVRLSTLLACAAVARRCLTEDREPPTSAHNTASEETG